MNRSSPSVDMISLMRSITHRLRLQRGLRNDLKIATDQLLQRLAAVDWSPHGIRIGASPILFLPDGAKPDDVSMRTVLRHAAVVLLSGGQDSTTCLAWAKQRFKHIECVTIDYGQRHHVELEAARRVAKAAGVAQTTIPCDSFRALGGNSLTGSDEVGTGLDPETGLPNTFVPGRNLVFLTLAAAFAWQRGIAELVTGVCQTDFSGYPDCRLDTMTALQTALRAGIDFPITIHTPLMHLTKAETVHMLRDLGGLELLKESHTCYNGVVPPCGTCPACLLRAKGFAEAGIPDPLIVAS